MFSIINFKIVHISHYIFARYRIMGIGTMASKMDEIIKLYKHLSNNQILIAGKLSQSLSVSTLWTQRSIERGKYIKFSRTYLVDKKYEKITETLPIDTTNELLTAIAPSENSRAVIREVFNGKDERKQFLEIWSSNNLINTVDLTALDIHGYVYADADFGSLEWSPDETKIIYIAEKKLPKQEPFYKRKSDKPQNTSDGDSSMPAIKGAEYIFRQEWGEQLVGKCESVIAMYDVNEDSVKILESIPNHLCPGQISWSPDGLNIVGIVWDTQPRKLGLVYCTNRPSKIFMLDLSDNYTELSEDERSVQAPKFSPDGKYLIWLDCPKGGPHRSAMALLRLEFPVSQPSVPVTVVNIIETESRTTGGAPFYGLFNTKFPQRCWANDNRRLLFSSSQKCAIKSYVLDIESCEITELEFDFGSHIVLDVFNDMILVARKNYVTTDRIAIAQLPIKSNESSIIWKVMGDMMNMPGLENITHHYMDLSHDNNDAVCKFNAIYLGPRTGSEKTVPLIVWPHGGPHSSYFNGFTLESALFASLGFAMVFVNYRGSLGAGQKSVDYLRGRVGDADVKDCVLAAEECCKQFPWLNPNKMVLCGGSHGGFLVHHLSGQYPDMFKAVLSRNPVIDIASMSVGSDIPDWCTVEAGSEYTQKGPVNDDLFLSMRKASPIEYAHQVKAPTYLMIGSKDLRVPSFQGIEFYHRLRANDVTVRLNLYDDNHTLGSVANEMDNIINGALWFLKYTT